MPPFFVCAVDVEPQVVCSVLAVFLAWLLHEQRRHGGATCGCRKRRASACIAEIRNGTGGLNGHVQDGRGICGRSQGLDGVRGKVGTLFPCKLNYRGAEEVLNPHSENQGKFHMRI